MTAHPLTRILAVLTLMSAVGASCSQSAHTIVLGETLVDRDLAMAWAEPVNRDESSFSEQFKIKVALDGGGEVYTRLIVSNIATLDGRAEFYGKVELPDGAKHEVSTKRDRGEWTFGTDSFDATVVDHTVKVTVGRAEVHVAGDGFTVDYTITTDLPALRPRGGTFERGGAFYTTTIPIPHGRLEGRLVVETPEGPAITELAGAAYVEHRAGNLAPYRMAKRWFRIGDVTSDKTVIFSAFQRTEELGSDIQGWLLVVGGGAVEVWQPELVITPSALKQDKKTGYAIPQLVYLAAPTKEGAKPAFRGIIRADNETKRADDLRRLSSIERLVVRRLMRPWTYEFDEAEYLFKQRVGVAFDEQAFRGTAKFDYQQLNE